MDLNTAQLTALAMARADVLNHWAELFQTSVEKMEAIVDGGEFPEIKALFQSTVAKTLDQVYPVRDASQS